MDDEKYTREEAFRFGGEFPERGPLCPKCKTHIPQFEELRDEDAERLKELIKNGEQLKAMEELRRVTGCSLGWAKIWTLHPDGPEPIEDKTAPCPFCGLPLRTENAKQCRHCKRDWHNPNRIEFLA